ncbi:hypothetical protein GCM10009554_32890 [Kribbella koreensis]|uniref:Fibronectin type III domain-containing protein n=2 Tax=Kribbella TaxID=182639 RepID=A0ABP6YDG4_9ACTN
MRKPLAAVTAALILASGTQLPASAAAAAPTDLQVGWADATTGKYKITWQDSGEANRVKIEYEDSDPTVWLDTPTGAEPNEYLGQSTRLRRNKIARIIVVNVDETNAESAAAISPWFDTNLPGVAEIQRADVLATGAVQLTWYREPALQDTTLNDPLDQPSTNEHVIPAIHPTSGPVESFPAPAGVKTATVPPRPRPYSIKVRTQNEWGYVIADRDSTVEVTTLTATLGIPAVGQYLSTVKFSAEVGSPECFGVVCGYGPVYLQARADATKPWRTIGKYNAEPPKFSASIGVYGGRQYRLYVPAWSYYSSDIRVAPALYTAPRYSAAQAKFSVVGFNTTSAKVGQLVKATVNVLPAGTVKADLQWFDGKVWRHAAYIALTKGKGTLSFKASGRGTTRSWRVTVPKMSMNGLPILATTSRTFKLAVR